MPLQLLLTPDSRRSIFYHRVQWFVLVALADTVSSSLTYLVYLEENYTKTGIADVQRDVNNKAHGGYSASKISSYLNNLMLTNIN
jgi:hypothetical protein